jgi:N-acetylmuramoyl-L-alanine amidase
MNNRQCLLLGLVVALATATTHAASVSVCFLAQDELRIVQREVADDASTVEAAVAALLAGPTTQEVAGSVTSAIPAGTSISQLVVDEDSVTIDFSADILNGGLDDARLEAIHRQVSWTLDPLDLPRNIYLKVKGVPLADYLPPIPSVEPAAKQSSAPLTTAALTAGAALSGKSISLSPGHGLKWAGSSWSTDRPVYCSPLNEEDYHNLELSVYLNQYLTQDGATVKVYRCLNKAQGNYSVSGDPWWHMSAAYWLKNIGYPCSVYASNTNDCTLGSGSSEANDSLYSRGLASNYDNTDLYISIHTNGLSGYCTGSGCPTGTATYYCNTANSSHTAWGTISANLASAVQSNIISVVRNQYGDTTWKNRGTVDSSLAETRMPERAAILIELAFHDTCDHDSLYLEDNFFRSATMWATYKGVCDYLGVTNTYAFYSDEYVSDTIPTEMEPGKSYAVSVTFRNRGVLWTESKQIRLGAVDNSDPFSSATRVQVSGEVDPGSTYTFSFTLTAPSTTGTYTTDWRMLRESVTWFGDTVTKQVVVKYPAAPADFDLDLDVDAEDFGYFQKCITGINVAQTNSNCEKADMDGDSDVDDDDFAIFQACLSGPGLTADVNCAED